MREDVPGLSEPALVLTPVSATDPTDDGLLTASEIADLDLAARFVALSACNTAGFDLTQMSEDLPALASAFAVAGVPATLATLWPVDSETSKRVVADVFARLHADAGLDPARALPAAQRAFIRAPPGRAYLHPRFWAPFIVLGDGGGARSQAAPADRVDRVELLDASDGGEVLAVARTGGRTLARFIAAPDARGRHAGAIRAAGARGAQLWRKDSAEIGASGPLQAIDGAVLSGGYRQDAAGRTVATLEVHDPRGVVTRTWATSTLPGLDATILGEYRADAHTVLFAVAANDWSSAQVRTAGKLQVFRTGAALVPEKLIEIDLPQGRGVDEAVVVPLGDALVVGYTQRIGQAPSRAYLEDDYDQAVCGSEPTSWIELRDGRTGALRGALTLPGVVLSAAETRGDRVVLAGSSQSGCADEPRAYAASLDRDLRLETLFRDPGLGASEIQAVARLPAGRVLILARKTAVTDVRVFDPKAPLRAGDDRTDGSRRWSAMLVTMDAAGKASAPKMLDSGFDVFASALDASDPRDIVIGGSLAGRAALFHLVAAAP